MRSARFSFLLCLAACTLLAAVPAAAPGSEPFFPRAGNRGYDVSRYTVGIDYRPGSGEVRGRTRVDARATQGLRRFALDLVGLEVTEVRVDGRPAKFSRGWGKLKVALPAKVARGDSFSTVVVYRGTPRTLGNPSVGLEGWVRTDDGALALGEPLGTAAWIPCNNVPADKASFVFELTVPGELKAAANGRLREVRALGRDRRLFRWSEENPMSTYLALLAVGRGRLVKSEIAGLPSWTLVDPRLEPASRKPLRRLGGVIRFQSRLFGGYPFGSAGSIVDYAPRVGYALETQSRPIYTFAPELTLLVHETAHQWFGNSVGLERWPNIWLNEGLATWTEWYYAERHGGRSAEEIFDRLYQVPAARKGFWEPPSGHPGSPEHLFATSVYVRGAMAVQALREEIGTKPLLRVLRRWAGEHRHGSANIKQFIALAERVAGRDLEPLFRRWLYQRGKPR